METFGEKIWKLSEKCVSLPKLYKVKDYMKKTLLIISLVVTLITAAPVGAMAGEMEPVAVSEQQADDMRAAILVNEQTVTVSGAQGETLEVVSLTGKVVKTIAIESPAQRIELNLPKGCYILKVGKVVRKISIR